MVAGAAKVDAIICFRSSGCASSLTMSTGAVLGLQWSTSITKLDCWWCRTSVFGEPVAFFALAGANPIATSVVSKRCTLGSDRCPSHRRTKLSPASGIRRFAHRRCGRSFHQQHESIELELDIFRLGKIYSLARTAHQECFQSHPSKHQRSLCLHDRVLFGLSVAYAALEPCGTPCQSVRARRYSVSALDGDTLVVDTAGFEIGRWLDYGWLDGSRSCPTGSLLLSHGPAVSLDRFQPQISSGSTESYRLLGILEERYDFLFERRVVP